MARARPGLATVVRPEDAARLAADIVDVARASRVRLNDGVDGLRALRRDGEADASGPRRQSAGELRPGRAAVGGTEDAAEVLSIGRRRSRSEGPGLSLTRVERGIDCVRIRRIERHVPAADTVAVRR